MLFLASSVFSFASASFISLAHLDEDSLVPTALSQISVVESKPGSVSLAGALLELFIPLYAVERIGNGAAEGVRVIRGDVEGFEFHVIEGLSHGAFLVGSYEKEAAATLSGASSSAKAVNVLQVRIVVWYGQL